MPNDDPRSRLQLTLPPLAWALLFSLGLLLVLIAAGMATLVVILQDSRDHIRAQDAKTAVLLSEAQAAKPTASALARAAGPLVRDAAPLMRDARHAFAPLGDSTAALASSTTRIPALVREVEALVFTGVPVLSEVGRANLPAVLGAVGAVTDQLLERSRLTRVIDAAQVLLTEVRAEHLVPLAARAGRQSVHVAALLRELLRVQRATLRSQRASLATQLTTLDVQRQALAAINSIDRKTGGRLPPRPTATGNGSTATGLARP
jgi:hypothetical protein